jgi:hypothetical protein
MCEGLSGRGEVEDSASDAKPRGDTVWGIVSTLGMLLAFALLVRIELKREC